MLSGTNPWAEKRAPKLTEEAKLAALLHDDQMPADRRQQLQAKMDAIINDETLTKEEKKKKLKDLADVRKNGWEEETWTFFSGKWKTKAILRNLWRLKARRIEDRRNKEKNSRNK